MSNGTGWKKIFLAAAASLTTFVLAGCALGTFPAASAGGSETGPSTQGAALHGLVHGGQNPISGASIYLFAAGANASAHTYGTGAASLLTSSVITNNPGGGTGTGAQDTAGNYYVTTDANGNFSITGDYSCPGATTVNGVSYPAEVYLLALGGDSGSGSNSDIALMAALGPCTSASQLASSVPFILINEVTTVAAVWSLQQFMGAPTGTAGSINIGAPSTNLVGLQNAFTTAANLVDIGTGTPTPVNNWVIPEADRIYTIADILAYCINSISSNCNSLFASVKPSSSSLSTKGVPASSLNAPADTIQAAWYMAQFPANVSSAASCGSSGGAFACVPGSGAPFPATASAPSDWTLAVGYAPTVDSTSVISDPFWVALDGFGNAWISNYGNGTVVPLAPNGSAMYAPVSSYTVSANSGYAANLVSSSGITSAVSYTRTISHPRQLVVDSLNNVWLADNNGSTATDGETAISGGSFSCPTTSGETCYFGTVAEFPAATAPGTSSSSGVAGYYVPSFPFAAAADASGNVYFSFTGGSTAYGSKTIGKLNASGAYTSGGSIGSHPYTLALDNNTAATGGPLAWVVNQEGCTATAGGRASTVFQFPIATLAATTTSGLTGANTGCTSSVHDIIPANTGLITGFAFDSSNNMWMVNSSTELGVTSPGTTGALNTVTYGIVSVASGKASVPTVASGVQNGSITSDAGIGGLNNPQYAEVDGAGNLWVANYGASSVSELNVTSPGTSSMTINSLSGANGFQHAETGSAITNGESIGIDLSGNVWVTSPTSSSTHYITVLVGAATPVGPPLPGSLGVAP